jgi:hypothetical protein
MKISIIFFFIFPLSHADTFTIKVTPFKSSMLKTLPQGSGRPKITRAAKYVTRCLSVLDFTYRFKAFDHRVRRGQLIVNNDLVDDLKVILRQVYAEPAFAFASVTPIDFYGWDDDKSMRANNTSGFNYRYIAGTKKLSNHSAGRALDINPRVNPWVSRSGRLDPSNGTTDPNVEGSLLPGSRAHYLVDLFKSRGFVWGGDWKSSKDYQHFEKRIRYPGNKYCERAYR